MCVNFNDGSIKVIVEPDYFIVKNTCACGDNFHEYNIEKDRCKTPEEILNWALHISEKTWMSKEGLRQFIGRAMMENGIKRQ